MGQRAGRRARSFEAAALTAQHAFGPDRRLSSRRVTITDAIPVVIIASSVYEAPFIC
jgi:hypothetical protein